MVLSALNPRHRSLPRGIALVLGSLVLAFMLAGFPDDRASLKLLIPTIAAALGTWDTIRGGAHLHGHHGLVHDPLPFPVSLRPLVVVVTKISSNIGVGAPASVQ